MDQTTRRTTLKAMGISDALVDAMDRSAQITAPRCYQHPESPTGYVGAGKWCEHKRAALARARNA